MMEGMGGGLVLLLLVVAAAGGAAAGWYLRRAGERARRKALDAYYREYVRAANTARDRARQETGEIKERMEGLRVDLEERSRELERVQSLVGSAEQSTIGQSEKIARLERAIAERDEEIASLRERLADADRRSAGESEELQGLRRRVVELDKRLKVEGNGSGTPSWLLVEPEGAKDDLQAIRGLGPVLERSLNELGIFHYRQLAAMTNEDVNWLAPRLNLSPGRIRRDDWPAQAKLMHFRKYRESI